MRTVKEHSYLINVYWTGNLGSGTSSYTAYKRDHRLAAQGKPAIPGSSDPSFRGDPTRYNPEELLVGAISACHMLWYLHLCAVAGIVVTEYEDEAAGKMLESEDGGGRFTEVILKPRVAVKSGADLNRCNELHETAHRHCFIANSVNFSIRCEPETVIPPDSRVES